MSVKKSLSKSIKYLIKKLGYTPTPSKIESLKKSSEEEFYLTPKQIKEEIQLAAKYNDFAHIGFLKGITKRNFEKGEINNESKKIQWFST